jgi:crotonobetainyl-CoA:carnitine CoA-transferase CaiB-like acyl-CoA transferase
MGKRLDGKSLYAASIFRNKKLVSLDLRSARGRELAADLAAKSDIVVENFRPGTMERMGLSYEKLAARNPGVILVRISGFGQSGPYAQRAGYGAIGEALSGLRHLTGDPDRPPARISASVTDEVTAIYGALGAMMALHARQSTGRGQVVDACLYESAFSLIEPHVPAFDKLGLVANRTGSRLPDSAPNNTFVTSDGRYLHITAMGDAVFARLASAIGRAELTNDPLYATQVARSESEDALDGIIAAWTCERSLAQVMGALTEAGIPAAPIYTVQDIFADPHFAAREMLVRMPDEDFGSVALPGVVPKLSATPGEIRHAGRRVGEDTVAVLKEVLGVGDDEIARLERERVIATHQVGEHAMENAT